MKNSVSTWLSMSANLRSRLKDIQEMKSSASTRKIFQDKDVVEEPTYSIKDLDKKSVDIHNALFQIDKSIKESNARTDIELDVDYTKLMEAIQ